MTNFIIAKGKSPGGAVIQVKTDPYNRIWIYYPKCRRRKLYRKEPVDVLAGFEEIKEQLMIDGYKLEV